MWGSQYVYPYPNASQYPPQRPLGFEGLSRSGQQSGGGYSGQQGGYPPQGGYSGQQGGYGPQGGYPGQQGGYPPPQGGYPGQQSAYIGGQPGGYPPAPNQSAYAGGRYSPPGGRYTPPGGRYSPPPQQGLYPNPYSVGGGQPQPGFSQGYPQPGGQGQFGMGYGGGMQGRPGMYGNPTIRPYQAFNPNADAEMLRQAMKGFGCDNNKVIAVLCARCNFQRQQIAQAFKTMYGKDLLRELRSELRGDFEDLILALMEPPPRYDAIQLNRAVVGIGTRESVLIEIMCSRTNEQIMQIKTLYRQMFGRELERDLIGDTSGHFQRLLVSMCAGGRDESMRTDPVRANADARALLRAGEGRLGTDESCFNAILAAQNYAQLRLVFQEYYKIKNHTIEQAINAEFSGDIRDGLQAIVACVQNRPGYFAKRLYDSMKGLGTADQDLIRVVVSRSEIDLADIRSEFERFYHKTLESFIIGDCSGAYKNGLIALVRGN